jgi:DNA-binding IclR family transcriptional regulator
MRSESVRTLARVPAAASSRSLTTARSVLRVLSMLVERPSGVRADEVAEVLGKSVSTAYYLLTSLCEEGFAVHESQGVYCPAPGMEKFGSGDERTVAAPTVDPGLAGTVQELFLLTRRRSYLGVVHSGKIEIVAIHGRQGVPRMPRLGTEIRDSAHALAMGKVVLSLLKPRGVMRYAQRGLKRFTEHTVTDVAELTAELEVVRQKGYAVEREEFDENFCCIAAPIFDADGHFIAALGLSTSSHIFDRDCDALAQTVLYVAQGACRTAPSRPLSQRHHARRPALRPVA